MNESILFDRAFDKPRLKELVRWTFQRYGSERSIELSERLKNLGFCIATKASLSLGIEDLFIPKEKLWITQITEKKVGKSKIGENMGAVTNFETNQTLVRAWAITGESLKNAILGIHNLAAPETCHLGYS